MTELERLEEEARYMELKAKMVAAPEAEWREYQMDTFRAGNRRMDGLERKCAPCQRWHGWVLRFLLGIVIVGAGGTFCWAITLIVKHVSGG